MKAFVISINGQPCVTAGIGEDGVLTADLTWAVGSPPRPAEGRLEFHIGGVDGRSAEHVKWSIPKVGVGDEIAIRIVDTEQVSPEDERSRPVTE